jgi:dipeptidyl aminopeptidase/acylaminoacyl peptidase
MLGAIFLAEGTLHPGRRASQPEARREAEGMALKYDAQFEPVSIDSKDGATLSAWSITPKNSNGSVVILLHGLADNRSGMAGYAELFLANGLNVLLPDARAHGDSGGNLATYGLLESDDIRRWIDWLETSHPACIFGFGESMGAAQMLQSLQIEHRFCAVAVESPFSSLREIAYDRIGQFFGTGPWLGRTILRPVVDFAFLYGRWKYGVDLEQVSPKKAVTYGSVPVLLIHGHADSNISIRHSRLIVAENPRVVLWEVPGADHCGAVSVAPQEFKEKVLGWYGVRAGQPKP